MWMWSKACLPLFFFKVQCIVTFTLVQICQNLFMRGLSLVGWYHSHPRGPALPSLQDIDSQMDHQLRLQGSNNGFQPCLGIICGQCGTLDCWGRFHYENSHTVALNHCHAGKLNSIELCHWSNTIYILHSRRFCVYLQYKQSNVLQYPQVTIRMA